MGILSLTSVKPGFHPEFEQGSSDGLIIETGQLWAMDLSLNSPAPQRLQHGSPSNCCKNSCLIAYVFCNSTTEWRMLLIQMKGKKKRHQNPHKLSCLMHLWN